jgi:RNA polymerase sigma-70 factor (ECF subfamily)
MLPTRTSLILRVRDRTDADSWAEFVELYEPLLLSYVRSRGPSEADARDIVQDIFILLLKALPDFELDHSKGRFRTWLWRIMMSALADRARRQRSRGRAETEWVDRYSRHVSPNDTPDPAFVAAHRQRVLEYVLPRVRAKTQPRTWKCFEQHLLRGRPCAEIAADEGITANAVCVNATRVLVKVRQQCADYMEELGDDADALPGR